MPVRHKCPRSAFARRNEYHVLPNWAFVFTQVAAKAQTAEDPKQLAFTTYKELAEINKVTATGDTALAVPRGFAPPDSAKLTFRSSQRLAKETLLRAYAKLAHADPFCSSLISTQCPPSVRTGPSSRLSSPKWIAISPDAGRAAINSWRQPARRTSFNTSRTGSVREGHGDLGRRPLAAHRSATLHFALPAACLLRTA
jgi:hypothetical protein